MQRKIKYIVIFTVVVSIFIFEIFTSQKYASDISNIQAITSSSNCIVEDNQSEIRITNINKDYNSSYDFVMYGDSNYEGNAYIPLAIAISENIGADVRIIKYNFLGNINALFIQNRPSEIIVAHGDGSTYLNVKDAKAVVLLGSTSYRKMEAENVMVVKGDLDMVSEFDRKTLPAHILTYKIPAGNFSNYVYADMHKDDAPTSVSKEEQITMLVEYLLDFISTLDL